MIPVGTKVLCKSNGEEWLDIVRVNFTQTICLEPHARNEQHAAVVLTTRSWVFETEATPVCEAGKAELRRRVLRRRLVDQIKFMDGCRSGRSYGRGVQGLKIKEADEGALNKIKMELAMLVGVEG